MQTLDPKSLTTLKQNGKLRGSISFDRTQGERQTVTVYTLDRKNYAVGLYNGSEIAHPIRRSYLIEITQPQAVKRNNTQVTPDFAKWLKLGPHVPTVTTSIESKPQPVKTKAVAKPKTATRATQAKPAPKSNASHNWTNKQLAYLASTANPAPGVTLRDLYNGYRSRFGQHAATFNKFRTRRYVLLNPEVGRARVKRTRENLQFMDKIQSVQFAA